MTTNWNQEGIIVVMDSLNSRDHHQHPPLSVFLTRTADYLKEEETQRDDPTPLIEEEEETLRDHPIPLVEKEEEEAVEAH